MCWELVCLATTTAAVTAIDRAQVLGPDGVDANPHTQGDKATCPMEEDGKQQSKNEMTVVVKGWPTCFGGGPWGEDETHLHNPQSHCHDCLNGQHKDKDTVLAKNLSPCLTTGWQFGPEQPQGPAKDNY